MNRLRFVGILGLLWAMTCALAAGPATYPADGNQTPRNVDQLRSLQTQVMAAVKKSSPACVMVFTNAGQGSGVVVSADGIVLTAGHVVLQPEQEALVIFPDGQRAAAKTLGYDRSADAGMVKLDKDGPWPFVERGKSGTLKLGQFVVAMGQPSRDLEAQRPPVVRLGRILRLGPTLLETDCTLDHGDSGGALIDLDGKLVAINGAIGASPDINAHVPIDVFNTNWDKLLAGKMWGVHPLGDNGLGIEVTATEEGCRITGVVDDSPAARAGVHEGDLLQKYGATDVHTPHALLVCMAQTYVGQEVTLSLQRDGKPVTATMRVPAGSPHPMKSAPGDISRASAPFKDAFHPIVAPMEKSIARIRSGGHDACLGILVSADGKIITEASLLEGPITCVLAGRTYPATQVSSRADEDIALLQLDLKGAALTGLTPIKLADAPAPEAGQWVIAGGGNGTVAGVGVVSTAKLTIPAGRGVVGITLNQTIAEPRIIALIPGSPAERAGIKPGDVILAVDGKPVDSPTELTRLLETRMVGEQITLKVKHDQVERDVKITLAGQSYDPLSPLLPEQRAGANDRLYSPRTSNFTDIFQHDAIIRPADCGGPVVDLDGHVIGLNVARVSRAATFAVPSQTLQKFIDSVKPQ